MLKTVHKRKTKRLLINSTSFLLPPGGGKLVRILMMHPDLLLGEQSVYLKSNLVGWVKETRWKVECASSSTSVKQGDVHQVAITSQKGCFDLGI